MMALHKFKIGDVVDFAPGRRSMPASANAYKIVKLLPAEAGQNIYRVKCSTEPFERIAREGELTHRV